MKNKILIGLILIVLSTSAYSSFSNSLRFSNDIEESCGLVFKNRGSIAFKNEEPELVGDFEIVSNVGKRRDYILKIKNLQKSTNLLDVNNSKIYIVIDRTKRIKINKMISSGVKLRSKNHKMYIYVEKARNSISSGRTTISFELEIICKT